MKNKDSREDARTMKIDNPLKTLQNFAECYNVNVEER